MGAAFMTDEIARFPRSRTIKYKIRNMKRVRRLDCCCERLLMKVKLACGDRSDRPCHDPKRPTAQRYLPSKRRGTFALLC
jgi:hypothetical protein